MPLTLLSAGAAHAVATQITPAFEASHSMEILASFGAVGFMRDRLVGGEACDVIVLSAALIAELTDQGRVVSGSSREIGTVATGIAVQSDSSIVPPVDSTGLRATFAAARGIYVPDLQQSTAGRHIATVLAALGLADAITQRIHAFPNGATAMAALASSDGEGLIGCTQVTEILQTPGVTYVADLPGEYALETLYVAAVTTQSSDPATAATFVEALTSPETKSTRMAAGFRV